MCQFVAKVYHVEPCLTTANQEKFGMGLAMRRRLR